MIKLLKNFVLIKLRLNSSVGIIYFELPHPLSPRNLKSLPKIVVWECSSESLYSFLVSLFSFFSNLFIYLFLVLMDTSEVVCLCSSLSMNEQVAIVVVSNKVQQRGDAMAATCLLGKILTSKSFNNDVFVRSIPTIWKFTRGIRMEHIEHFFFFCFSSKQDRHRILAIGHWHFNRSSLVLSPLADGGVLTKQSFNSVAFWLHILNVPLKYTSKEMTEFIRGMLGVVEQVDVGPYGDYIG